MSKKREQAAGGRTGTLAKQKIPGKSRGVSLGIYMRRNWQYYALILPSIIFIFIFKYIPMWGVQIAFRDYRVKKGIFGSEWVGLKYFVRFLTSDNFKQLLLNTLELHIGTIVASLVLPVVIALMLNEVRIERLKKGMQMVMYAPHFISVMALCGIIILFTQRDTGLINIFRGMFGAKEGIDFLGSPRYFTAIYVISHIWQNTGWGTIIYMAALSNVDPQLVEAATIDGASRLQVIRYINIPSILPTIIMMMILSAGSLLSVGYEKIVLLQTPLNMEKADVISTYVYRMGIQDGQYSYTTAIGLFNSIVNFFVLTVTNYLAKKLSGSSLW